MKTRTIKGLAVLACVAGAAWPWVGWGQTYSPATLAAQAMYSASPLRLKQSSNFNACLQYKVGVCFGKCPGPLGFLVRMPGVRFTYQEPTAIVEVSCQQGKSDMASSAGLLSGIMSGIASMAGGDQTCMETRQNDHGAIQRWFFEAHVFGYGKSPVPRLMSSATPLQVMQSLTCEVDMVQKIMNVLSTLGDISNFSLDSLSPANMVSNLQNGLSNTLNNIANMPANLMNSLQSSLTNITNTITNFPTNLGNQLTGITDQISKGITSVTSGQFLTDIGNKFTGIGNNINNMADSLANGATSLANGQIPALSLGQLATAGQSFAAAGAALALAGTLSKQGDAKGAATAMDTAKFNLAVAQTSLGAFASTTSSTVAADTGEPEVAETVLGANGKLQITGKLMQTGSSQIAAQNGINQFNSLMAFMSDSKKAADDALKSIASEKDPRVLCSTQFDMKTMAAKMGEMVDTMKTKPVEFFPLGTYVGEGAAQMATATEPVTSCPLTHAGYISVPFLSDQAKNTTSPQMVNCRQVCKGGGNNSVCEWLPMAGYAGDCNKARITQNEWEGFKPACNGQRPKQVYNTEGELVAAAGGYDANIDQRKRLNDLYTGRLIAGANQAKAATLAGYQTLLKSNKSKGIRCDAVGNPVTAQNSAPTAALNRLKGWAASSWNMSELRPAGAMAEGTQLASSLSGGSSIGSSVINVSNITNAADQLSNLMRSGGFLQFAKSFLTCKDPTGLCLVFASELAKPQWSIPPFDAQNFLTSAVVTSGLPLFAGACGAQALSDLGLGDSAPSLDMGMFYGCWGTKKPSGGWAQHKEQPVAAMLIWARALDIGHSFGTIERNKKGTQQFNLDYPQINAGGGITGSFGGLGGGLGGFKGSKCYDVGAADPRWYTKGESLIGDLSSAVPDPSTFTGDSSAIAAKGFYSATAWKHTSCCITPCGVHREY